MKIVVLAVALLQPAPVPAPPPLQGEAGLSYVRTSGNSAGSTLGASLRLTRVRSPWTLTLTGSFLRSETADVISAERREAGLRGERAIDHTSLFGQATYRRDAFAGIDGQETLESGALYRFTPGPAHVLSGSLALTWTAEQRIGPDPDKHFAGARTALAYKGQLSPTSSLVEEVGYLQSFKESRDGRFSHRAELTADISRRLAIRLQHQLQFLRLPAPGKQRADQTILASVVARFPRPAP